MIVELDVGIEMDDGVVLRADVFRPRGESASPVVLSLGPYGKGLSFQEGRAEAWRELVRLHPEVLEGSSNRYQCWEVADPERWVPHGYACVRVDARGAGRSPGVLDPLSARETDDLYACVEWAGEAPWSTGRVGLLGVSYHAINQWQVACKHPPHLAAICPWEGGADHYRDLARHGGILSSFWSSWFERRVLPVQHGVGERGPRSAVSGELVAGPETLTENELAAHRVDMAAAFREHDLDDEYYRERSPELEKITVPLLSAANWGGQGLHERGNFDGFLRTSSTEKWLEVHGGSHWEEFSTSYGVTLQRSFFDRFLHGADNGFGDGWRVQLRVRHIDRFVERREQQWPLARTVWTRLYLDPASGELRRDVTVPSSASYDALGTGLHLLTEPFASESEITGPVGAQLWVSTTAADADLFAVLRLFAPDGAEVVFRGAQDPRVPLTLGWLRLSQRDADAVTPEHQPRHPHRSRAPVRADEVVRADIELWPTSIVVPPGYRVGLTVRGRDYQIEEEADARGVAVRTMNGVGRCVHDDIRDRSEERLAGVVTLYGGGDHRSVLVLPVVP